MTSSCAFIGFGEAGRAFARPGARAFDLKSESPLARADLLADYGEAGLRGFETAREALDGADVVLCLVTADQAEIAARDYSPLLDKGALWLDLNSVAPETKRRAASAVEAAGAHYVDVAIMAPVEPARLNVPLWVSGPHSEAAMDRLRQLGFTQIRTAGPNIGDASAIKMIRSVMVKGIEALTAECLLAGWRAGVVDRVIESLDSGAAGSDWTRRAHYNLDRMLTHGTRRSAEMDEVARTLEQLGIDPVMTRAASRRHREIGSLEARPASSLLAMLAAIDPGQEDIAR